MKFQSSKKNMLFIQLVKESLNNCFLFIRCFLKWHTTMYIKISILWNIIHLRCFIFTIHLLGFYLNFALISWWILRVIFGFIWLKSVQCFQLVTKIVKKCISRCLILFEYRFKLFPSWTSLNLLMIFSCPFMIPIHILIWRKILFHGRTLYAKDNIVHQRAGG
jgi:hypothetical protein